MPNLRHIKEINFKELIIDHYFRGHAGQLWMESLLCPCCDLSTFNWNKPDPDLVQTSQNKEDIEKEVDLNEY